MPVLERHVDHDLGVPAAELGEVVRHPLRREPARAGDPQRAARGGAEGPELQLGRLQIFQNRLAALEVHSARLSETQRAAVAVQQTDPEPLFHLHHMLAHHGGREVHSLGGSHEGARLDHLPEHPDAGQRIHRHSLRCASWRPTEADLQCEDGSAGGQPKR